MYDHLMSHPPTLSGTLFRAVVLWLTFVVESRKIARVHAFLFASTAETLLSSVQEAGNTDTK